MIRPPELIGLLVFVCASHLGGSLWEETLTENQKNTLESGEVLFFEPEMDYLASVAIQIEAPVELIWEVMLDHERLPDYVKDVRMSEVKESGEDWKVVAHRLKMHALLPQIYYVFKEKYGEDYFIEFELLEGGIKDLMGWWKITPGERDGTFILWYSVYMDIGWYVPMAWVKNGVNKRVPRLLKAFRDEVYSDLETRKDSSK